MVKNSVKKQGCGQANHQSVKNRNRAEPANERERERERKVRHNIQANRETAGAGLAGGFRRPSLLRRTEPCDSPKQGKCYEGFFLHMVWCRVFAR